MAAETSRQYPERMVWDLEMTVGDVVTTLFNGWVYVPKDVTTPRGTYPIEAPRTMGAEFPEAVQTYGNS